MRDSDPTDRIWRAMRDVWADTMAMTGFLSRLPVPMRAPVMPRGLRALPVAGAVVGLIGAAALLMALWVGLPPLPAAIAAIVVLVAATGALHEDGLADVADGFGGGTDRDEKLEIMRDSRIGSYGVVALVLSLALRVALIAALVDAAGGLAAAAGLVVAASLSRTGIAYVFTTLAPARADGLGHGTGQADRTVLGQAVLLAVVIAALLAIPVFGTVGFALAAAGTAGAALWMTSLAKRQIGGQTGDVGGATQQVCEMACLTMLMIST